MIVYFFLKMCFFESKKYNFSQNVTLRSKKSSFFHVQNFAFLTKLRSNNIIQSTLVSGILRFFAHSQIVNNKKIESGSYLRMLTNVKDTGGGDDFEDVDLVCTKMFFREFIDVYKERQVVELTINTDTSQTTRRIQNERDDAGLFASYKLGDLQFFDRLWNVPSQQNFYE